MIAGTLLQAALFQLTWFACVIGGGAGSSLWGAGALAAMAAYAVARGTFSRDVVLAAALALIGFCLDTVWIRAGVLSYGTAALAPPWIVMLWAAVGLSFNHSLAFLRSRPLLGGVLAAAAAPFSYLAGEALGAVTVPDARWLAAVSSAWLVVFAAGLAASAATVAPMGVNVVNETVKEPS